VCELAARPRLLEAAAQHPPARLDEVRPELR
jgi:hypothetical protein